jgi:hypothetical protein
MNSQTFLRPPLAASEKRRCRCPEGGQGPPDTRLYVQSPVMQGGEGGSFTGSSNSRFHDFGFKISFV